MHLRDQNGSFLIFWLCEKTEQPLKSGQYLTLLPIKGSSLNDMIHSGPKLQQNYVDVLIHFRRHPVALVGHIFEMFLQVGLAEEDRLYHCILWQNMEANSDKSSPHLALASSTRRL